MALTRDTYDELRELLEDGTLKTDSDLEDYARTCGLSEREVFWAVANIRADETECAGCQYVIFRPDTFPCTCCVRSKNLYDWYKRSK